MAKQNRKTDTLSVLTARQGAVRELIHHLNEVITLQDCLDNSRDVLKLHAWRKATRKMRYTLEIFQNQLFLESTPLLKSAIAVTEKLQQYLGVIHDADILVPHLTSKLVEMLNPGTEFDKNGNPVVGTDLVDWQACMGLQKLCMTLKTERHLQFETLTQYYTRVQKKRIFEKLLALCQESTTS